MITFVIIAYIIPVVLSLLWNAFAYFHVNGIFSHMIKYKWFNESDGLMFLFAFMPIVNIYIAIQWIQEFPIEKSNKQ